MEYTFYEGEEDHTFADNASIKPSMLLNPEGSKDSLFSSRPQAIVFEENVV